MLPLLGPDQERAIAVAEAVLDLFDEQFNHAFVAGFRRKLGLLDSEDSDAEYIAATLVTVANEEVDFTLFFRHLTRHAGGATDGALVDLFASAKKARTWIAG